LLLKLKLINVPEHKEIVTALQHLVEAPTTEDKLEYTRFAEKLMAHARIEEGCPI
jgi:hypothetical protein